MTLTQKPPAKPKSTFNTPLCALNPAPVKSESWWLTPRCQEDRAAFQREAAKRHPSGTGGMYRRIS